jgi:hypothetical protein
MYSRASLAGRGGSSADQNLVCLPLFLLSCVLLVSTSFDTRVHGTAVRDDAAGLARSLVLLFSLPVHLILSFPFPYLGRHPHLAAATLATG